MFALAVLLALTAQSKPPTEAPPGPPAAIDPLVAELLHLDERDDAYQQILARQVYRGPGHYFESPERIGGGTERVNHVVVCPQREGPPIFAVVLGEGSKGLHRVQGHLVLIDGDGAILRVYRGANAVDSDELLADVNDDGIVDFVGEIKFVQPKQGQRFGEGPGATVLHVVPMTREQVPILRVAFSPSRPNLPRSDRWTWRLKPVEDGPPEIEIGPVMPVTGTLKPRAAYKWSPEDMAYGGPDGGKGPGFIRLGGDSEEELWNFVGLPPEEIKAIQPPKWVASTPPDASSAAEVAEDRSATLTNRGMIVSDREFPVGVTVGFLWTWESTDPVTYPDHLAVWLRTDGKRRDARSYEIEEGLVVRFNPAGEGNVHLEEWKGGKSTQLASGQVEMKPSAAYKVYITDRDSEISVRVGARQVLRYRAGDDVFSKSRKVAIYNREGVAGVKNLSTLRGLFIAPHVR